MVLKQCMITFQGELRERKDATFQTAHEPQSIAAREHNGQIRDLLPHPPDEPFEFSKDAEVDASGERGLGIRTQQRRMMRGADERKARAVSVQGAGPHVHSRGDAPTHVSPVRMTQVEGDAGAQVEHEHRTPREPTHCRHRIGEPVRAEGERRGIGAGVAPVTTSTGASPPRVRTRPSSAAAVEPNAIPTRSLPAMKVLTAARSPLFTAPCATRRPCSKSPSLVRVLPTSRIRSRSSTGMVRSLVYLCRPVRRRPYQRWWTKFGALAQLVEQWIENPCVPSSILGGTTPKDPAHLRGLSIPGTADHVPRASHSFTMAR